MHFLIIRSIALLFIYSICCPVMAIDIDEEELSDHSGHYSILQTSSSEEGETDSSNASSSSMDSDENLSISSANSSILTVVSLEDIEGELPDQPKKELSQLTYRL